ncbi:MAG TPA: RNA methyltransferase [Thiolapillus brandeum]|uniref:tRNA (cytidine/uridine-2'-O-)-methyltransferase TrmJ n=1 Tax=Thiolapillus brandeum TaxID=1076588 RepID=A0A7C5MX63_9GAMM|nr:RNA methyltransferase [Thiolapillus brandeum]
MQNLVRIVLVETSHGGNIGAVARAMKNMCLEELALVRPQQFLTEEAAARASGADDLLQRARLFDSLEEALADCQLVIGASARLRKVRWPQLDPRQCAQKVVAETAAGRRVALVFGRERTGLTNAELDLCHYLVHIPANPEYSSLNLAMAVQVIAYELRMAETVPEDDAREQAPVAAFEGFMEHLAEALYDIGYLDERNPEKLLRRLRRLFHRAELDAHEINILRGILNAAQGNKRRSGQGRELWQRRIRGNR